LSSSSAAAPTPPPPDVRRRPVAAAVGRVGLQKLGIAQLFHLNNQTVWPHLKGFASERVTLRGVGFEPATIHLPAVPGRHGPPHYDGGPTVVTVLGLQVSTALRDTMAAGRRGRRRDSGYATP
jgi:hypothetical protein